jgi:hypothetical protein
LGGSARSEPDRGEGGVFRDTEVIVTGDASGRRRARPHVPLFDPPAPSVTEEELEAVLQRLIKRKTIPDAHLRKAVIVYARKKSSACLVSEAYDTAADCDAAVELVLAAMRQEQAAQAGVGQTGVRQERLAACRQTEKELQQSKVEMIGQARDQLKQKLILLDVTHEQERANFEAQWSRPEAKLPFAKPSGQLLQLRQQKKLFALVHDFHNAKALKQASEAMERREAAEAAKRFEMAVSVAWEQLLDKQARERQCLIENREHLITTRTIQRDRVIASNERIRQALEVRVTWPKHVPKPSVQVPSLKGAGASTVATSPPCAHAMVTHRTRTQLVSYRKAPDTQRLELHPAEVRSIVRPSPRKGKGNS